MLLLMLAALSDTPAATRLPASPPQKCEGATNRQVTNAGVARIRPLTEEPPARQEFAVAYSEGGCMKPVTLKAKLQKLPEPK
ncbi:MAG: hypothetical protein PGN21_09135 [Sphingomonas paucimobilis]